MLTPTMPRFTSVQFGILVVLGSAASGCTGRNPPPDYEMGRATVTLAAPTLTQMVGSDVVINGTFGLVEAGSETDFSKPVDVWIHSDNTSVVSAPNDLSMSADTKATFSSPDRWYLYFAQNETRPFTLTLRCLSQGQARVYFATRAEERFGEGAAVDITCTDLVTVRKPREFAIGVADLLVAQRSGAAFDINTMSHGVTANLYQRTPELASKFTEIGANCERYEGVTAFPSVKGPDTVSAKTDSQNATATWDPVSTTYKWAGLTNGPDVFGASNKLTFAYADSAGAPDSLEVTAPAPFTSAATTLTAPKGLDTEFHVPDGDAQHVLLFGAMTGGAGFSCDYLTKDLPLVNGYRATKVVPDEVRAAIPGLAGTLTTLYLAKSNAVATAKLFSGTESDVHAARMVRVNAPFLEPPPP